MGFHPAYKYKNVLELTFESGRLLSLSDRSPEMQEIRLRARHTGCAHAQVGTLRLQLLKLAAWVEVSVRRVVVHLPRAFPADASWLRIAGQLGAVPP